MPVDEVFRARLRGLLARTGLSQRRASLAFGRDVGYVQSLLDVTRPSRARPTPSDLLAFSDATGIPFVELLEEVWDVPPPRLASELAAAGRSLGADGWPDLSAAERQSVADYIGFLQARHPTPRRLRRRSGSESP